MSKDRPGGGKGRTNPVPVRRMDMGRKVFERDMTLGRNAPKCISLFVQREHVGIDVPGPQGHPSRLDGKPKMLRVPIGRLPLVWQFVAPGYAANPGRYTVSPPAVRLAHSDSISNQRERCTTNARRAMEMAVGLRPPPPLRARLSERRHAYLMLPFPFVSPPLPLFVPPLPVPGPAPPLTFPPPFPELG